jgi:hypothetical protein
MLGYTLKATSTRRIARFIRFMAQPPSFVLVS